MNLSIGIIAFVSEYLDSGLGMGYGTALAPLLIIMGYEPLKVVPAILISQLFTDIAACIFHHNMCNVDLKRGSTDFKVASLLGLVSVIGVVISVVVAVKIPKWLLTFYIGAPVLVMGIIIIITIKRPMRFSWRKIAGISLLASFNKGISGWGYGPLVIGGQLTSGVNTKNAVGITAFAEALICLVGFIIHLINGRAIDWKLTGTLVLFATGAVPLAALTVKNAYPERLKRYVGIFIIILGLTAIFKMAGGVII